MEAKRTKKEIREDYDAFVEKFKPKKTTDDCYTPQPVYDTVVKWVNDNICPLDGVRVVRPFYPGGDYEGYDYPEGCVVLDNPPFSIVTKICRFYNSKGIKYFLFCPALTAIAGLDLTDETYIIAHGEITYENGAVVRTSFRTNILKGDPKIIIAGDLRRMIAKALKNPKKKPKAVRSYDPHCTTAALLGKIATRGIRLDIGKDDCMVVRRLDNCDTFSMAVILSERAAAECAAAERADVERADVERVSLSEREWAIVKSLGQHG